jgi:hypothetical protein
MRTDDIEQGTGIQEEDRGGIGHDGLHGIDNRQGGHTILRRSPSGQGIDRLYQGRAWCGQV